MSIRILLYVIGKGFYLFLSLAQTAIFAHAILAWFVDPFSAVMRVLSMVTEPFVAPVRSIISRFMGEMPMIDFSPMITLVLLSLISSGVLKLLT